MLELVVFAFALAFFGALSSIITMMITTSDWFMNRMGKAFVRYMKYFAELDE